MAVLDLAPGFRQRLASLTRDQQCQALRLLLHQPGEPPQHPAAVIGGPGSPVAERCCGGVDRTADICSGEDRNFREYLVCRRVVHRYRRAIRGPSPFGADQVSGFQRHPLLAVGAAPEFGVAARFADRRYCTRHVTVGEWGRGRGSAPRRHRREGLSRPGLAPRSASGRSAGRRSVRRIRTARGGL